MTPQAQEIYDDYHGLSDDEIIESFCCEYFEDDHVREALTAMHIAEHEVMQWIYFNIK